MGRPHGHAGALALAALLHAATAAGEMDIGNRGPMLTAGDFALRVTNVGAVGNAFFDVGLSNDPSFESPALSGAEALNYAMLWVGARLPGGRTRVSGGPLLEWRPTLAPEDRVLERRRGDPGTRRGEDDDGDGRTDEERLDGRDDDGDGWIDEDLGLIGDQLLAATYRDDEPASIHYQYPGGESHEPLGITVHQEAVAWAQRDYRRIAALTFRITNHGARELRDVRVGLYADLDSRRRADRAGHRDDRAAHAGAGVGVVIGEHAITAGGQRFASGCVQTAGATIAMVSDARADLPHVAVVPLEHTVDPLARIPAAAAHARAPARVFFTTGLFVAPGERPRGSAPVLDDERYAALAGGHPQASTATAGDFATLTSCGPFPVLRPGETIEVVMALVAAPTRAELIATARAAAVLHHGTWVNLLPDSIPADEREQYLHGETGTAGHESCVEPPPDVSFVHDPHCPSKFRGYPGGAEVTLAETRVAYVHGRCVWTDADCTNCTPAWSGAETRLRWHGAGGVTPRPAVRLTPGDRAVTIEWDNLPEALLAGGAFGGPESRFLGYRLYKVQDWRDRIGEFPAADQWMLLRTFGAAGVDGRGETPLAAVTDSGLAPIEIVHEQPRYPVGRYRFVDRDVLNGFHYAYVVTAFYDHVWREPDLTRRHLRMESALAADPEDVVVPQAAARPAAGGVWVVPNPFRGDAAWDRPPILHDALTRHVDFMGLPRARCTIRIYTLAGDLVEVLDHDGSGGDGQAAWNLVSRSGQDVASGVYLFTVESPLGRQTGRFVILR